MSQCHFRHGEAVDPAEWNKHERPANKLVEPVIVTGIEAVRNCQSGWMITVSDVRAKTVRLDQEWLKKIQKVSLT